jgi:hypothetical protein
VVSYQPSSSIATMPPLPAAVMACVRAKLVTTTSARARAGCEPRVEHVAAVFDHQQTMTVGDLADAIPVGTVADEIGREDRARARRDHLLDAVHVDLERVGLHVDESGDDPRLHQRRHVGRERHDRRDHLVAGLAADQVDREPDRGRPRVHHHAVLLGEQLRDRA